MTLFARLAVAAAVLALAAPALACDDHVERAVTASADRAPAPAAAVAKAAKPAKKAQAQKKKAAEQKAVTASN